MINGEKNRMRQIYEYGLTATSEKKWDKRIINSFVDGLKKFKIAFNPIQAGGESYVNIKSNEKSKRVLKYVQAHSKIDVNWKQIDDGRYEINIDFGDIK